MKLLNVILLLLFSQTLLSQYYDGVHEEIIYDVDLKKQFEITDSCFIMTAYSSDEDGDSLHQDWTCTFKLHRGGIVELELLANGKNKPKYSYWTPDLNDYKLTKTKRNPKRIRIGSDFLTTVHSKTEGSDSTVTKLKTCTKKRFHGNLDTRYNEIFKNGVIIKGEFENYSYRNQKGEKKDLFETKSADYTYFEKDSVICHLTKVDFLNRTSKVIIKEIYNQQDLLVRSTCWLLKDEKREMLYEETRKYSDERMMLERNVEYAFGLRHFYKCERV